MKRMYVIIFGLLIIFSNHNELSAHEKYLNLPHEVIHTLDYRYGSFDLIHSEEFLRRGRLQFKLILLHRSNFLEITVGANGRILSQNRYRRYPLQDHFCGSDCRFHFQHRHGAAFVSYDPYAGCRHHRLAANYHRYFPMYQYERGGLYYQPEFGHYKRLKQRRHGYQAYDYRRHGNRNSHGHYGHHKNSHHTNRHWGAYDEFNSRVEKHGKRRKYQKRESHKYRHEHSHRVGSKKPTRKMFDPEYGYTRHYGG